ncbi:helix-loop-helix protein delilah [Chironomus tepperi]|uniref:helix-loop-helix protein delilah n=1 Tax=Chironomus tepperi TaxID=113505 RepID=UPI00391F2C9A
MHHKNNNNDIMQSIITIDQSPDVTTMESDQNNNNENSSNNNLSIKKNEKYSLRQRGQRKSITNKHLKTASYINDQNINNNSTRRSKNSRNKISNNKNSSCDEVDASTLSATTSTTVSTKIPKEKPKQKAAPLSKYRRKTANARERTRMREINHAFENLRQSVPVVVAGSPSQSTNEKLTKITTLRMAMKYITILSDILDNKAELSDNLLASLMDVDSKNLTTDMDAPTIPIVIPTNIHQTSKNCKEKIQPQISNVLAQNHHDYCKEFIRETIVKPVKSSKVVAAASSRKAVKANAAKTKKPPSKSHSKSQKINLKSQAMLTAAAIASNPSVLTIRNQSIGIHSNNHSSNMTSESKFINHLLGGNFNHSSSTTMINGSGINNNSLNCLSKYDLSPCLTPPNDDCPSELGLILESDGESLQLSEPCFSPLEFGLLLESDGESLHLSEPCLSPLSNLDAFNSINDLLHGSFSEHNSLEMYLS